MSLEDAIATLVPEEDGTRELSTIVADYLPDSNHGKGGQFGGTGGGGSWGYTAGDYVGEVGRSIPRGLAEATITAGGGAAELALDVAHDPILKAASGALKLLGVYKPHKYKAVLKAAGFDTEKTAKEIDALIDARHPMDKTVMELIDKAVETGHKSVIENIPVTPGFENSWTRKITEGAMSVGPAMAAGLVGGSAALATFGAAVGYGNVFRTAMEVSNGDVDASRDYARIAAIVGGASEPTLGAAGNVIKTIKRLNSATEGWLSKVVRGTFGTIKTGTGEGIQEGAEEIPPELARQAYEKERTLFDSLSAIGESAVLGGIVGTIFGGFANGLKLAMRGAQQDAEFNDALADLGEKETPPSRKEYAEATGTDPKSVPPADERLAEAVAEKAKRDVAGQKLTVEGTFEMTPEEAKKLGIEGAVFDEAKAPEASAQAPPAGDAIPVTPAGQAGGEISGMKSTVTVENALASNQQKSVGGLKPRQVQDRLKVLYEQNKDVIESDLAVLEGEGKQAAGAVEGETAEDAFARPAYSFPNTREGRSAANELKRALPANLRRNVAIIKKGNPNFQYADGNDIMASIGTDRMANAIIAAAGNKPKTRGQAADFMSRYILNRPEQFPLGSEAVMLANKHLGESIAATKQIVIDAMALQEGDSVTIKGESFTVGPVNPESDSIMLMGDTGNERAVGVADELVIDEGSYSTAIKGTGQGVTTNLLGDPETDKTGQTKLLTEEEIDNTRTEARASELPQPKPQTKTKPIPDVAGQTSFLKQKAADAKAEAADLLAQLKARTGDKPSLMDFIKGEKGSIDPENVRLLVRFAGARIRAGAYSVADFLAEMVQQFTDAFVSTNRAQLTEIYNTAVGSDSRRPTSTKNAVVDQERASRGLPPAIQAGKRDFGEVWDQAMRIVDRQPRRQDALIAELQERPRALTDVENALLLHRQIELQNEYDKTLADMELARDDTVQFAVLQTQEESIIKQLVDVYDVGKAAGTETSRGLAARKMLAYEDFSLAKMISEKRRAMNVATLSPDAEAEVKAANQKIADLQRRIDEYEATKNVLPAEAKPRRKSGKIRKAEARYQESLSELKSYLGSAPRANFWTDERGSIDPNAVRLLTRAAVRYVGLKGREFAGWVSDLTDSFGAAQVRSLAREITQAWNAAISQADRQSIVPVDPPDVPFRTTLQQSLNLPETRVLNVPPVAPFDVGQQPDLVDVGESGDPAMPSGARRKLEKQSSLARYANDLARYFVAQGVKDRGALIDAVHAELLSVLPNLTRREAMDAISGYGQYKGLNKEQIATELRDLKGQMQQIGKLEDMAAGAAPRKTGVERRSPSDEERRLIQQVNEAKKLGGYAVTDPETQLRSTLQSLETRLRNQIADLEEQISTGQRFVKEKAPVPTSEAIESLRQRRDELRAQFDEIFSTPGRSDAQRLAAYKTRTQRRIAELEDKLERGDFAKKERRPDLVLDKEAEELRVSMEKAKRDYMMGLESDRRARRSLQLKLYEGAKEAVNTSRAIVTSFDVSAVGRQGGILVAAHPIQAGSAMADMFESFASEKGASRAAHELSQRKNAALYRRAKLSLTDINGNLSQQEEVYMSYWAKSIPGVRGSERAYVAFLNRIRADVFDSMVATLGQSGTVTEAEAKIIANYVNVATGRGDLGRAAAGAEALATVFFAPRYVLSRFQYLTLQPLRKGLLSGEESWRARKLIAKEYARSIAGLGVFYGTAAALLFATVGPPGDDKKWDVEFDPRSSDFLKIRIGKTRIDPMAGLQQATVLLSRLISGETKAAQGNIIPIRGEGYRFGIGNTADVIARFARTKLSPVFASGIDLLSGTDVVGGPVTLGSEAAELVIPLNMRDIYEATKEQGMPAVAAITFLSLFGIGVQTHQQRMSNIGDPVADKIVNNWNKANEKDIWSPEGPALSFEIKGKNVYLGAKRYDEYKELAGRKSLEILRARLQRLDDAGNPVKPEKPTERDLKVVRESLEDGRRAAREELKTKWGMR